MNTNINIDAVLEPFGIKYFNVESGNIAIRNKLSEVYGDKSPFEIEPKFWCEVSWGSGLVDDQFDCAINEFGDTVGEAITGCLNEFINGVREGYRPFIEVARHNGIYDKIMSELPYCGAV